MNADKVWTISRGLRGQAPIEFAGDSCCRVRHADPQSPIHVLSECGDARCGAHRLNYPEVRQRFRTFITRSIRKSKKDRTEELFWMPWRLVEHQRHKYTDRGRGAKCIFCIFLYVGLGWFGVGVGWDNNLQVLARTYLMLSEHTFIIVYLRLPTCFTPRRWGGVEWAGWDDNVQVHPLTCSMLHVSSGLLALQHTTWIYVELRGIITFKCTRDACDAT